MTLRSYVMTVHIGAIYRAWGYHLTPSVSSVVLQTLDLVLLCEDMTLLIQIAFPLLKVPRKIHAMTILVLDQTVN